MPAKPFATASLSLVNFAALMTRFSLVIAGPFFIMTLFPTHHLKIGEIAQLHNN
jgi:hypothetical protein